MKKILYTLLGFMIIAALLLSASPAAAATFGEASGSGDFYADDTGSTVTPGGRAHFTFVAKLKEKKGPIGQLEFRYPLDNLKVRSTIYNFITFNGAQTIIAGECIKNDTLGCTFELVVFDDLVDFFALTVMDGSGAAVYQGYLAGGNIVVSTP